MPSSDNVTLRKADHVTPVSKIFSSGFSVSSCLLYPNSCRVAAEQCPGGAGELWAGLAARLQWLEGNQPGKK